MPLSLLCAVEDLVLWRDPKKSGGIVGATVLLYILLGPLSPITLPQLLAAVVLVTCPLFAAWHNAAPLLKRSVPLPGASHEATVLRLCCSSIQCCMGCAGCRLHRLPRLQLCNKLQADSNTWP